MTLDEAIVRFKNKVIAKRTKAEHSLVETAVAINKCAEECEQIVRWLEELKLYRESNGISENIETVMDNNDVAFTPLCYKDGIAGTFEIDLNDPIEAITDCTGTTLDGTTEVK